ncbi:unnamed protein product, partial [Ilex paraguariensis]
NHHCDHSFCGNIHNISFPFRLKDDPKYCGNPKYELACENNVTVLYLGSHKRKYLVQSINYPNFTIRLVDSAVQKIDNCSFLPQYPLTSYNFTDKDPYSTFNHIWDIRQFRQQINKPIIFLNCPYPVDSPLYLEIGQCINGVYTANSSFSSSSRIHSYVNVSGLRAVEVRERCSIELMVMTSWAFKDHNNISFSDIYDAIEYGFELSWFKTQCENCELGNCFLQDDNQKVCVRVGYCSFLGMAINTRVPLRLSFIVASMSLLFDAVPFRISTDCGKKSKNRNICVCVCYSNFSSPLPDRFL